MYEIALVISLGLLTNALYDAGKVQALAIIKKS